MRLCLGFRSPNLKERRKTGGSGIFPEIFGKYSSDKSQQFLGLQVNSQVKVNKFYAKNGAQTFASAAAPGRSREARMKTSSGKFAGVSLIAILIGGSAHAQQALPTIEVGAAPLRSSSRSAPRSKPVVEAAPVHNSAPVVHVARPLSPAPRVAAVPPPPPPAPVEPVAQLPVTPAAVNVTTAKEIAETRQFDAAKALERVAPGVVINDVTGNPFQPEVDFRGFVASPVSGTPEGLAVYMNGIRINEAWGDTVNWDLIP